MSKYRTICIHLDKQKYLSFKAADFLLDEDFRQWQLSGDPGLAQSWEAWLLANPHKREEVEKAVHLFRLLKFKYKVIDAGTIDREWIRLRETIAASSPKETQGAPFPEEDDQNFPRRRRLFLRISVAAAVVVAVLAGAGYSYFKSSKVTAGELTEYTAPRGQRLSLSLEDGTRVLLNAGSTVTYPKKFSEERRELKLIGEAFFDVAPDPRAPFVIRSGDVTTEVIGTSFGIAAYPSKNVDIAVVTGKVKVYASGSDSAPGELFLTPNQMATFEESNKAFSVKDFDQSKQLAWVSGVLYFDKADFQQIRTKLENWYGVTVVVSPGLELDENLLLTGKYKDQPLEYVLEAYRYPDRFRYQIKNDTVTIF